MEAWPKTAFDQLHELCGLTDTNLQNWTTDAMGKMEGYHARALSGGHKELDALVAKTVKLLERVPKGGEGKFRGQMRKDGTAIATAQAEIAEVLARMKTSYPSIDEEHPASVAEAGEGLKQVRDSYKSGARIDDFCC